MKAVLKNYRQSPRKVRLLANAIKGKGVSDANSVLYFLTKRASLPVRKLLASAVANAVSQGENTSDLFIKSFTVDKGVVLKRMMPRAQGSGFRINKRTSNLVVVLGSKNPKVKPTETKTQIKEITDKSVHTDSSKSQSKTAKTTVKKKVASKSKKVEK